MDRAERRAEILRRLEATGFVGSSALARELGVSEMTVRRDFDAVQDDGLGRRVPGGLGLADAAAEATRFALGLPFGARDALHSRTKRMLAQAAATRLAPGMVVALDAGTTVSPLAELAPAGCTVVSHSVPVINRCTRREDIELIGLGGDYQRETRSFGGPTTRAALADLAVDVAVLSATAVGPGGTYSTSSVDADTKRAMAAAAGTVLLLADSTKLAVRAPIRALVLDQIDLLVTEAAPSAIPAPIRGRVDVQIVTGAGDE